MFTLHTVTVDGLAIDRHYVSRADMNDDATRLLLRGDQIVGVTFPDER